MPNRPNRYHAELDRYFASNSGQIDVEDVFSLFPSVKPATVVKHIRSYLDNHLDVISRIVGVYPSSDSVIRLAEQTVGPVSGSNLSQINVQCKTIIDSITKPSHKRFLEDVLGRYRTSDGSIRLPWDNLVDILYEQYVDYVHESDNGLVSIAGGMNEKILIRGLESARLIRDVDFRKTGQNSAADIQIEHHGRTTEIMYCEVKSYAARERLLRGLQDIHSQNKIGVGFFTNPAEFNPARTRTLLAAGPLAIYMPESTYSQLSQESTIQVTRNQDRLYRPLGMFVSDMLFFKNTGRISAFQ